MYYLTKDQINLTIFLLWGFGRIIWTHLGLAKTHLSWSAPTISIRPRHQELKGLKTMERKDHCPPDQKFSVHLNSDDSLGWCEWRGRSWGDAELNYLLFHHRGWSSNYPQLSFESPNFSLENNLKLSQISKSKEEPDDLSRKELMERPWYLPLPPPPLILPWFWQTLKS